MVPVAGYVMDVCIEGLDKIIKTAVRKSEFHGRQASDKRLYAKREDGGRG